MPCDREQLDPTGVVRVVGRVQAVDAGQVVGASRSRAARHAFGRDRLKQVVLGVVFALRDGSTSARGGRWPDHSSEISPAPADGHAGVINVVAPVRCVAARVCGAGAEPGSGVVGVRLGVGLARTGLGDPLKEPTDGVVIGICDARDAAVEGRGWYETVVVTWFCPSGVA
jgi:hypothetical protein